MLLRMYLRWAERRGFKVEMKEASPGEEAGLKSATFVARGENAYGLFAAERGVHRLVRISPFDSSARRHTSFAQVDVAPLVEDDVEVEIDDGGSGSTPIGPRGQAASTSTRPTRPSASPTSRLGSSLSPRTSAPRSRTARRRCRSCVPGCSSAGSSNAPRSSPGERGEQKSAEWGSQIRSYFLHPDQRVKDHRTGHEVGDTQRVLDGDLDGFVREYLNFAAANSAKTEASG